MSVAEMVLFLARL